MATQEVGVCARCSSQLIYSIPAADTDTTTRNKIERGYYHCNNCTQTIRQEKKRATEDRRRAKKQRIDNIKQREETKTQIFERYWRDVNEAGIPLITVDANQVEIVDLPEHRRLMEIYKKYGIRDSASGFLAYEEAKIIRREQIQMINDRTMDDRREVENQLVNEEMTKEDRDKKMIEIELWKKTQMKKQIHYVDNLHAKANKEWENKPRDQLERMVKEPGFKDPEGNKAPRYHLLSRPHVFQKRHAVRIKQITNIERIDGIEKQISEQKQKQLFEGDMSGTTTS